MRKNEHPGCSCTACKQGKGSRAGQHTRKMVTRKLRRAYKRVLRQGGDVQQIIVSTPYTD